MGLSASKRVKWTLASSTEFNSACDSAYDHCLSLTQHAVHGVFPYQLPTAATHLHRILTTTNPHPSIIRWVPSPPTRSQVDFALRVITRHDKNDDSGQEEGEIIGTAQFKEWALVLFVDAVVGNAGKAVLRRVPIGIAGISGIGAVTRSNRNVVGAAIGVYALGVATSVFLSL
ncbi:hypothetical protein CFOL_v3_17035 [Cephalotus follicularis]|uniref:Uncharacterized protein n=1 Tax=Cephalotus follicularis TaxID=3775 RepID=A0A1Q3C0A0_CEPFO|nr:hypothetical protein CFOL_v3_17035 [Cephalotus follicularis]